MQREDGSWTSQAEVGSYDPDRHVEGDIWVIGLFEVQTNPRQSLSQVVEARGAVSSLETVGNGPDMRYKITLKKGPPREDEELDVVVDPSHNYLVSMVALKSSSPKERLRYQHQVLSFQETAPGIYFPKIVETTTQLVDKDKATRPWRSARTEFTVLAVNEPVPPDTFTKEIEPGVPVWDRAKHIQYKMGNDGQPTGEISPEPPPAAAVIMPTYKEEKSSAFWTWAVALAATTAFLAGTTYWLIRKRRATV
jgi:hypothetical protein